MTVLDLIFRDKSQEKNPCLKGVKIESIQKQYLGSCDPYKSNWKIKSDMQKTVWMGSRKVGQKSILQSAG